MDKPENIEYLRIDEVTNFVTNTNTKNLAENFAVRTRGLRHSQIKSIGSHDYGTIFRHSTYPTGIAVVDNYTLYIPSENKDYEIIVGLDSSNNTRIFVDDGTAVGTWTELTERYYATVTAVSSLTATVNTLLDTTSTTVTTSRATDYFSTFLAYNSASGRPGLITASTSYSGAGGSSTLTFVNNTSTALNLAIGSTITLFRCTGILPSTYLDPDHSGRGYDFTNGTNPHIRWLSNIAQSKVNMYYGDSSTPVTMNQPIQIRKGKFTTQNSFTIGGSATTGWTAKTSLPNAADIQDVGTASLTITGATNASPIVVTTSTNHNLSDGHVVYISGVGGNTAANGSYYAKVTSYSATTFGVYSDSGLTTPVAGNGVYTSGGIVEFVWVCLTDSRIYASFNGGDSWTDQQTALSYSINGIQMISNAIGYAVGSFGTVLKATSAYQRTTTPTVWSSVANAAITAGLFTFYCLHFFDATNGMIAGANGKIFITADGGSTWTDKSLAVSKTIYGVYLYDANTAWVCTSDGLVYLTTNGGTSWAVPSTTAPAFGGVEARDITFTSSTVGYVVGNGNLAFKTTNGGNTWASMSLPTQTVTDKQLYSVEFYDANNGRIAGDSGIIYVTTNAGSTWTQESTSSPTNYFFGSSYFSTTVGYACGRNCNIQKLSGSTGAVGSGSASGWYIDKAGLLPDFVTFGSAGSPKTYSDSAQLQTIGEGISVGVSYTREADPSSPALNRRFARIIMTLCYVGKDGTTIIQESDPVAQWFLDGGDNYFPSCTITPYIDIGRVNKNLYGCRFYHAYKESAEVGGSSSNWVDNPEEYLRVFELTYATSGWALSTTAPTYTHSNALTEFTLTKILNAIALAPTDVQSALGHVPDTARTYLAPRYAVKVGQQNGYIVVVDQDDRTLRTSTYNGDNVHMDDSFPDLSVDNTGRKLKIAVDGEGEMMGLGILNDNVATLFSNQMKVNDLFSGIPTSIAIDCVSKRSITNVGLTNSPAGLTWAGKSGWYYLPRDGSGLQRLNYNTLNFYDGSLMVADNVTPYVSDLSRQTCITGYDSTYAEIWLSLVCCKDTSNSIAITGATNATPIEITAAAHSFSTNDFVQISGVGGNTNANGSWVITKTGTNTFTLNDSTGNAAYTAGGVAISAEQLHFRYGINDKRTSVRKFSIGTSNNYPVRSFSRTNDGLLTLGYRSGLLKYPNRNGSHLPYEDDVTITTNASGDITAVATQSKGIETLVKINLGSIYSLAVGKTIFDILVDYIGTSTNNNLFTMNLYANGETAAYETLYYRMNDKPSRMRILNTGQIQSLEVEITFPSTNLNQFKIFDLKAIEFGIVKQLAVGNT